MARPRSHPQPPMYQSVAPGSGTWATLIGKPTTISGFGITDAYTKTETDAFLALKAPIASPAFTGLITLDTPAMNHIRAGGDSVLTNYNLVSLNGGTTLASAVGMLGGDTTDTALYLLGGSRVETWVGGSQIWQSNASAVEKAASASVNLGSSSNPWTAIYGTSLLVGDGSGSLPGIRFLNDADTGMYRPAENVLAFSSGGVGRMEIAGTDVQPVTDIGANLGSATKRWSAIYANTFRIHSNVPQFQMRDTDVAVDAGGLYAVQMGANGQIFRIIMNTAAAGDFSTFAEQLYMASGTSNYLFIAKSPEPSTGGVYLLLGNAADPALYVNGSDIHIRTQGSTPKWRFDNANSRLVPAANNTNDIGTNTGPLRIRDIFMHGVVNVQGSQVLSTRKTGWAAATGTATRTTFATGSVTLPQLAERVKALVDDLISHGLIGA